MSGWYCVINGQQHGPKPLSELQDWARQGVLRPTDLVWTEGMAGWIQAATVQGQFTFAPAPPTAPLPPPQVPPAVSQRPHRGTAVLVLGILGIVCCVIPGIIAWVMGDSDLRGMKEGRMDPSGRGLTQAGRICGIVSVVLAVVGIIGWLILVFVFGHEPFRYHRFHPRF
jgi:hypothetical protein